MQSSTEAQLVRANIEVGKALYNSRKSSSNRNQKRQTYQHTHIKWVQQCNIWNICSTWTADSQRDGEGEGELGQTSEKRTEKTKLATNRGPLFPPFVCVFLSFVSTNKHKHTHQYVYLSLTGEENKFTPSFQETSDTSSGGGGVDCCTAQELINSSELLCSSSSTISVKDNFGGAAFSFCCHCC